jgi:hypothetical protein
MGAIGKLEAVDIRQLWTHEERGFSIRDVAGQSVSEGGDD